MISLARTPAPFFTCRSINQIPPSLPWGLSTWMLLPGRAWKVSGIANSIQRLSYATYARISPVFRDILFLIAATSCFSFQFFTSSSLFPVTVDRVICEIYRTTSRFFPIETIPRYRFNWRDIVCSLCNVERGNTGNVRASQEESRVRSVLFTCAKYVLS